MNEDWSRIAANAIAMHAEQARHEICFAAGEYARPSVLYRPCLSRDGNQWCALYGTNLQDGVAGFGASVDEAMRDFDTQWHKRIEEPKL